MPNYCARTPPKPLRRILRMIRMTNFARGLLYEYYAAFFYMFKFYRVIARRYRNYCGEIDFIALRNRQLIFVEVKFRKEGLTENTLSINQRKRITRAAQFFIGRNPKYANYDVRFDFVVFSKGFRPQIIENAW